MIDPFGLKSMAGAATGPARNAAPDDTGLWGHSGRFKQPDGLQARRFRHCPVGQGLCLRNPSTLIDGAMRWAADLGGSPRGGRVRRESGGGVHGLGRGPGVSDGHSRSGFLAGRGR